jgi:hypothetical protein
MAHRAGGLLRLGATLVMLATLAGCVAFGDIAPPVTQIEQSVGDSLNQAILLNIVRASRQEPLYFTSISQIGGSGTADLKTGLPNIVVGAAASGAAGQLTFTNALDNTQSTNFQVGVLNSQDFYRGLLTPINLLEANLLMHQGFTRDMVFSLLVDRARLVSGGNVVEIPNDPEDPRYPKFQQYLQLAIVYGLTIESYEAPNPDYAAASASKKTAGNAATGASPSTSVPASRSIPAAKLCFDPVLTDPNHLAFVKSSPAKCNDIEGQAGTTSRRAELTFTIDGVKTSFEVVLRSPFQIFHYLGELLTSDLTQKPAIAGGSVGLEPLMVVSAGNASSSCFTSINYAGASYCIPQRGSDQTRQAFSLINQILALNTSSSDLPVTTTIQIAP